MNNIKDKNDFEVAIIGGGATGLGVAVEAASRGYKTILFEAYDFGKGTSSKSTKLVHGGLRYLANLDFKLVKEGLKERSYFLQNAPHLAHKQTFIIPFYSYWDKIKFIIGIFLYNFLAGNKKLGKSTILNKKQTLIKIPTLQENRLKGSLLYNDGQFDDARVLISLLLTFQNLGGIAYNYHNVTNIYKDSNNKINGLKVLDKLNNRTYEIKCRVLVNATGIFADNIL
ncbi:MAG TPA: FAD-dependent oxidoreductase, partial [Burkholderiales bacterium]|nr:FAD-dependent oxidoreductase [Burkholderiales bacterium]